MQTVKAFIFVTIIGLTLFGCSAHRTESATDKKYSLEYSPAFSPIISPRNSVTVSKTWAYQDGDELVVSGRVKRMHKIQLIGHVDLAICGPDGTLLAQKSSRIPNLASNRKGSLELPFSFRLSIIPPEGAKIRLQYHAPASSNPELSCIKS